MNGEDRIGNKDEIIMHILDFFSSLYSKDNMVCPLLNNLEFATLGDEHASWLERPFEEDEVHAAVFALGIGKSRGLDGFTMAFFQTFWNKSKDDIMALLIEFHSRGKLSKNLGHPS